MPSDIQSGAMMVRQQLLLPDSAEFESRDYSNAWRSISGVDNFAFAARLHAAGLHLFFIAGELKVIEPGWGVNAIRRGIKRILSRGRKRDLNCLQITKVRPAHFLGLPYVAIHGSSFHIQKGAVLKTNGERKREQQQGDWASG
jgi:hypothetical protein